MSPNFQKKPQPLEKVEAYQYKPENKAETKKLIEWIESFGYEISRGVHYGPDFLVIEKAPKYRSIIVPNQIVFYNGIGICLSSQEVFERHYEPILPANAGLSVEDAQTMIALRDESWPRFNYRYALKLMDRGLLEHPDGVYHPVFTQAGREALIAWEKAN